MPQCGRSTSRLCEVIADNSLCPRACGITAWGNYETNIQFLRLAGLDCGSLKILEIGCGKGAILNFLRLSGHVVRGIDVDPNAIRECVAAHPEIEATVASGDEVPFDDACFDIPFEMLRQWKKFHTGPCRAIEPCSRITAHYIATDSSKHGSRVSAIN